MTAIDPDFALANAARAGSGPTTGTGAEGPNGSQRSTDAAGAANQKLGKQEFLKLLVTQLRNQNPMNPMKGREMAVQLAQFSSVEQLIQLNETLSGQQGTRQRLQSSVDSATAAEMIGKRVLAEGDRVQLSDTGRESVTVDVQGGGEATLELFNAAGQKVGSREVGFLAAGRHEIDVGSADDGLSPGVYSYDLDIDGAARDTSTSVTTYTSGPVDGVRFGQQGPILRVGAMEIPFGRVEEVLASQ